MSTSTSIKSAINSKSKIGFKYTALNGETTSRTVYPLELVTGKNGEAVVAKDVEPNETRRFLVKNISGLTE